MLITVLVNSILSYSILSRSMTNDAAHLINAQTVYVALSAVIGALIVYEGMVLKKTAGKLPKSTFFHVCSVLDTVWFFVSISAFYLIDFMPVLLAVPTVYCVYTVFGWIYGTKLLKSKGAPSSVTDLVIPPKYIAYSQSFGVTFLLLCLSMLGYFFTVI